MSLRSDRKLTFAYRLAMHRRAVPQDQKDASREAWIGYVDQFDAADRRRLARVYYTTLHDTLLVDRRTRGRNS